LLETEPSNHLDAFYTLISSEIASDELFMEVYNEVREDRFVFGSQVIDDLWINLPAAVSNCQNMERCDEWADQILHRLMIGDLYNCPEISDLGEQELLDSLPYGNYDCTEDTATALAPMVSNSTISSILDIVDNHAQGWSRRNAVRTLGRFAGRDWNDPARNLVVVFRATDVKESLVTRLELDTHQDLLHDTIWVLDSYFYPHYPSQAPLEAISANVEFEGTLRFRAISAVSRLIYSKLSVLPQSDIDFLMSSLQSDDMWVRSQAAYCCERLMGYQLDSSLRSQVISGLLAAWETEEELTAALYIARALDRYLGGNHVGQLQEIYKAEHLGNQATGTNITIHSGLPAEELEAFVTLAENSWAAFFDFMGTDFQTPVPYDPNPSMVIMLFATRDEYREYMEAFIEYGADSGGLYLESSGTLYTYQRTPEESIFTVEQLVQHEISHFLQGRYVFPGIWGVMNYHAQPKGWADEGFAEFMAGFEYDQDGNYAINLRTTHLDSLCASSFRDLGSLLEQRAGYDEEGVFDYYNGWSFVYYLFTEAPTTAFNLYTSFRNDSYRLSDFAGIAGVPSIEALNDSWHSAMELWCALYTRHPSDRQASKTRPIAAEMNVVRIGFLPDQSEPPSPF
jgi:hypothetical protein